MLGTLFTWSIQEVLRILREKPMWFGRRTFWLVAIATGIAAQLAISGFIVSWLARGNDWNLIATRLLVGEAAAALFGMAALAYALRWISKGHGATVIVPLLYLIAVGYLTMLATSEESFRTGQFNTVYKYSSPADVAMAPNGDIYVLDWYAGNVKVVDSITGRVTAPPIRQTDPEMVQGLALPRSMHPYGDGTLIIADTGNDVLQRFDPTSGDLTRFAGSGIRGFTGDGGPSIESNLRGPRGVAVDEYGNVYIADSGNRRIRRIDAATGVITTVAGNGERGSAGDGGSALEASLVSPRSVAIDHNGNLYILDWGSNRVRRVDHETGIITAYAGTDEAGFRGDGGPATLAQMWGPLGIALDSDGNLYIADQLNHRIRRVEAATGVIETVVGTGLIGEYGGYYGGDGRPATEAFLDRPAEVSLDTAGNLLIVDAGNNLLRVVDAETGIIETITALRRRNQ
jgi:DNA-binding beta-propeller fold protein YncE